MAEICSEKVRCSSEMKPRLRAEWVVLREELCMLSSCFLSPMSKNSVLEGFRVRKLAVIHDGVAVASAGPHANHLHRTPDR